MKDEQYKKAQELHAKAAPLIHKRNNFNEAIEKTVHVRIELPKGDYFSFKVGDLPEAAQVIYRSMVAAMAAACDAEVKKIQDEFNNL